MLPSRPPGWSARWGRGQGFSQGGPGDVRGEAGLEVGIVADGVSRVRWTFAQAGGRRRSVTPNLNDNVAVAGNIPATARLDTAAWSAADGRVISVFHGPDPDAALAVQQRAAIAASYRQPVARSLTQNLGVLRARGNLARTTPGAALTRATMLSLVVPNELGLNVGQARFVPCPGTPSEGGAIGIWVVPGRLGAALLAGSQSISQSDGLTGAQSVLSGWFRIDSFYGDGSRTDIGIVPDGYTRVTVRGGATASAPVIDNVYSIYVPHHSVALLISGPARRTIRIPFTGDG